MLTSLLERYIRCEIAAGNGVPSGLAFAERYDPEIVPALKTVIERVRQYPRYPGFNTPRRVNRAGESPQYCNLNPSEDEVMYGSARG